VGAQKRTVLVALGIRPQGKKEVIDFRQARSESKASWKGFLNRLYLRGLTGAGLKLIITDGGPCGPAFGLRPGAAAVVLGT